ncbi:MAG: DUF2304 domain-containing protein [gamma proteobacterium symbiont of Taylorina sp.]|nr:DUF2304 domain-containing protein [gamma proteobacterium symbiont of Taylorina sp.]
MKIYLFITAFIGLFIAFFIVWLIRKDHMHVKYAFGWIIVGIISAIVGFSPAIVDQLAYKLDVSYPPILAIIIAFTFLLIKMFIMDIDRSKQERKLLRLTQKVGILEADLHQYKSNKRSKASPDIPTNINYEDAGNHND